MSPRCYLFLRSLAKARCTLGSTKNEGVVKVPVSHPSAECERVLTISNFVRTEYRDDVLNIDQPAQTARLNDPTHVEALHTMDREGR